MKIIKSKLIHIIILLSLFCSVKGQSDYFKLKYNSDKISIEIDSTFYTSSKVYEIQDVSVSGIAATLACKLYGYESYLRLIAVDLDKGGNEYLIFEAEYPHYELGITNFIEDYSKETFLLNNISNPIIKIEIFDAECYLDKLSYSTHKYTDTDLAYTIEWEERKSLQDKEIISKLNAKLRNDDKLWKAGSTSISMMSFNQQRFVLPKNEKEEIPNLQGFEYYVGGIIEILSGGNKGVTLRNNSNYVESFDWRNRHGENWTTSAKLQGCNHCWAFSPASTAESSINLYFNRHINYDLSEQNLVSCSGGAIQSGDCQGGYIENPLTYMTYPNDGVVLENCFSYQATNYASCTEVCSQPIERVRFMTMSSVQKNVDTIKRTVIEKGPICGGIQSLWHFMSIVGFKELMEGDTIFEGSSFTVLANGDTRIGSVCWLFKNSWGSSWGNNGFGYIIADTDDLYGLYKLYEPVCFQYNSDSILCTDNDGDGYYNWGIGPKPSSCLDCPDEPDCDDSDPIMGPYNEKYECVSFCDTTNNYASIVITGNLLYNSSFSLYRNIEIESGGVLVITSLIKMANNRKIIVKPGGKLIIDGGTLTSACPSEMWQGIQVWGDSSAPQTATNGVYQQGYVELKNGATIENAVCAIDLWKPNDLTKTGGIAIATDANFINNAKSVRAMYYVYVNGNNAEVSNKTSFSNCSFVIDEYYLGTEMFNEHAELEDVKGINFSGCSFDVFSMLDDVSDDCSAIRATDANFVVSAYFDPQNVTLYPTSVPSFSNFYAAINVAHSTYTQRPFNVSDAVFTNNTNGIYAINSGHPMVSNCEFNIPSCGNQCSYGIYVEDVSSMIISDNEFVGNGYVSNSCGIGVKDSPYTNTVKKNSFTALAYGNKAIGLNYYPQLFMFQAPEGLKYTCNTNSGNLVADFYVTKEVNMGGSFSLGGIMTQGASSLSAGNTFSASPMHHIYNSVSSNTLTYYYDTIYPDRKPTANYHVNAVKTNSANTCSSGNVSKGSIFTDYEDAENNCNRIKAALEAENNPNNIEVLEAELAQAEHQRLTIVGNAVRNILMDSISDINEVRQWLNRANTPSADRAICVTYLSQGDYETALNKAAAMIDKYEMEDDALIEQTEYIGILKLQRKVETEGRVMEQLNGEELGQVQRLAENGIGVARSMAKAIMMMNGMAEAECDCNSELAEMIRGTENPKADAVNKPSENAEYYFTISPVPAKDYIIVSYNLPTDHATLKITNNLGVTIKSIKVEGKIGKKLVSLSDIVAGVYSCTLQSEGFVRTEKIVVTK